ncbi:MAG: MFS transporter [Arenicellales bacterium]|nr:MFS transporter [Arenicellales bacterium]
MLFTLSILRNLSSLMISVSLLMFGNSMFSTLLALRANIEHYPNEMIGLMTSAYFLGFVLGTFRSGPLINRVGHIRTFAALAAIAAACALLVLVIPNPWAWVALRAAMGAATAGLFVVVESWLNNRAANESRGLLLSMYIVIGYIASAAGQQAIKLGDPGAYELFLFVGIVLALSLVPVSLTRATHPDPVETPRINIRRLFQVSPTSVIVCLGAGLINSSWWGLGPVYAREIGFSVSGIASFMTAALLGGMLLQLPIGRLSDRLDRRLVIFGVTIGVAIPAFALVLGGLLPSWGTLTAIAIFFGLASTLYPLSIAYANDYLDPGDVVAASGGFIMVFSVGAVAGPLAASAAMRIAGPQGMFMYIITIVVLLAGFIAWRMRVRQWAPVVEKEPYVLQPEIQTPGVISELDPRAEVDEGYDQGPDILDTPTADAEEEIPFGFWLGLFGIKPEGSNQRDADPEPTDPAEGVNSGETKQQRT